MGMRPLWQVYELSVGDERRYCGAGSGEEPWLRLSPTPGSDLERFLAAGPQPTWDFLPRAVPMSRTQALALVAGRVQQLRKAGYRVLQDGIPTGGWIRPIIRRWPDGRIERYRSIREAARITGLGRYVITRRIGTTDCRGCDAVWLDAANVDQPRGENPEIGAAS